MDISSSLQPLFWAAVAVLAVSAIVFLICINLLADAHRPALLRVVWISGSLAVASLAALVLLLVQG